MKRVTVIRLSSRRPLPFGSSIRADRSRQLHDHFRQEGRDLADLCAPAVAPFRYPAPELVKHLSGAFLAWQIERIKSLLADDPDRDITVGLSIAIAVESFDERMAELESDGGGAAA